jgi:hypothetical protein
MTSEPEDSFSKAQNFIFLIKCLLKITVFWDVTPYSLVKLFRGAWCLQLAGSSETLIHF